LSGTSKLFKYVSNLYVSILRGTPLILQLSIIYFALPMILEVKISVFTAGIVAFSINSAAYMFEHLKAGINGVDKGQIEAANAIGMTKYQTMKLIVIPQALRNIVPSLINEAINMVKESSIISVLGAQDIMRKAQLISSETYDYLTPLIIAGIYYYIIINVMNIILVIINKKVAR
ncbi:MAG: amino acid ABC transporter permease, partial [Alphaproteobacteria bacterium]|nr:amino acid ABC transporter permease [Alphaproteobacteria bacterium]